MASALYQGWPCQSVRFVRSRGYTSDSSEVVIFARDFPEGFVFTPPKPASLADSLNPTRELRGTATADGRGAAPAAHELAPGGWLVLIEGERRLELGPLWIVGANVLRRPAGDGLVKLTLTLADARHLWTRGAIRRWSFNRARGDGTPAADALKPDGSPWKRAEVVRDVAASLFGAPLVHVPEAWESAQAGPVEFPPYCPPLLALRRLADDGGALEPCLRLDGSVALVRPGEGRVGVAPAPGEANAVDVPPELILYRGGTGRGYAREAFFPPDLVLVRGRERVATVELDGWEPVLAIETEGGVARSVLPLVEETVRELTEGRYGLAALAYLVTAPEALGVPEGVRPEVARLLRSQAWRLWRMPGAVGKEPGEVGPNAHLLPMLPRAEVSAGRRLPVTVEVYRYETINRAIANESLSQSVKLTEQIEKIRAELRREAARRGLPDPFGTYRSAVTISKGLSVDAAAEGVLQLAGSSAARPAEAELRADRLAGASLGDLTAAGLPFEEVQRALDSERLVRRLAEVDSEKAAKYAGLRAEQRKVADEANGTTRNESAARVAKILLEFEDKVRAQQGAIGASTLEQARVRRELAGLREDLRQQLEGELEALRRQEEASRVRRNAGLPPGTVQERVATFVRNVPTRGPDEGARVYSAELGIVETSVRSGWVAQENVPSAEATYFVPKAPRVVFGATVRPRTDVALPAGGTRVRGAPPNVLGDSVTWFVRAYRRGSGNKPERVPAETVDLSEVLVIPRDDLGPELVPLVGEGNAAALELEAEAVARGAFEAPAAVQGEVLIVARPHLVQCDGVVQSVVIETKNDPYPGMGFTTTIRTGVVAGSPDPGRTRVRPPALRGLGDGAAREGLTRAGA